MAKQLNEPCRTCRWYHENPLEHELGQGECHREPPRILMVPTLDKGQVVPVVKSIFPPTKSTNWCGEYDPVPAPES